MSDNDFYIPHAKEETYFDNEPKEDDFFSAKIDDTPEKEITATAPINTVENPPTWDGHQQAVKEELLQAATPTPTKVPSRRLFRSPYITKGLKDRRIFDTPESLPGSTQLLTQMSEILNNIFQEIKRKGIRSDSSLQERLLHDELQVVSGNTYSAEENFSTYFEDHKETSQYLIGKNGIELGIRKAVMNPGKLGTELIDDKATAHTSSSSQVSVPTTIYCFNSGIQLVLAPFTVSDISRLTTLIALANDVVGRSTAGAAFTGDDVHLYHQITDTLLQKVTHTNVKELNSNIYDIFKVKEALVATDLVYILAGGLATMYPRGYPVFHPCATPNCDYNIAPEQDGEKAYKPDSLLDFNLVTHTRHELFDNADSEHWSKPIVTLDDIRNYKLCLTQKLEVEFPSRHLFLTTDTDIGTVKHYVTFKIPSLNEYFSEAKKWCSSIETFIAQTVDQNRPEWADDKTHQKLRETRSEKFAVDTALGKYIHFINYIETITNDDPNTRKVINDRNTLLIQLLDVYSADADALINVTDLAKKAREAYSVGWTGVPNFQCPVCGSGQADNEEIENKLIPLNLLNFFYTVMSWRYLN